MVGRAGRCPWAGTRPSRIRRRRGRDLGRGAAARPGDPGLGRRPGTAGDAVERRAGRAAGGAADRGTWRRRRSGRGGPGRYRWPASPRRNGPGCASHEPAGRPHRRRQASPRLPDAAAERAARHRPGRRVGLRLVFHRHRRLRSRDPRAAAARSRSRMLPEVRQPGQVAGTVTAAAAAAWACGKAPWWASARGTTWRPRSALAWRRESLSSVSALRGRPTPSRCAARRPVRRGRRVRRRRRRLPAAVRHAQLHPGRRPDGRAARARPRGRRAGRHRGRAALPGRRAHAQPPERHRADHGPAS